MHPEDIKLNDWPRIFLGEVPPAFIWEVILRIVVLYTVLILAMRLLGKRMASQLSRNELAAMSALAAAVGLPILSPDRGLLPPIVMALVVVSLSRLVALISAKNPRIEAVTQGNIETLVKDSVIQHSTLIRVKIPKERILAQLRSEDITHLGEVKRLFMESDGSFTLIKNKNEKVKPGLPVIPEDDREFFMQLSRNGILVCHICGNENKTHNKSAPCQICKSTDWVPAVSTQRAETS